jgi:proteasome lid subunit RPN8/RPN11
MTDIPIRLPRNLVNQLLHCAQLSPDRGACGLVGAMNGSPHSCYPIGNVAPEAVRGYAFDPQECEAALREIRERGETLFAVFHSHPDEAAEPSAEDLHHSEFAGALRLIISLNTKGVLELRCFRIDSARPAAEIELWLTEA